MLYHSASIRQNKTRPTLVLRTANLHFRTDSRFAIYSFGAATVRWVVTINTISLSYVSGLPTLTSYCRCRIRLLPLAALLSSFNYFSPKAARGRRLSQDLALEQGIGQPHSKLRCLVSLDDGVGKGKGRVKHFVFCALMAALVGLVTLWSTLNWPRLHLINVA